ncbi:MAG: ABC transporter permease [Planctomycetota bacterium]
MIARELATLLRLGLRNLMGYKLRTGLTMLGVLIGVIAVIVMMAIAAGAEQALLDEIGRLGIENIIINSVQPPEKKEDTQTNAWQFNRYGLTFKDEKQIRNTIPGLKKVLPVHKRREPVWWGSKKVEATVYAVHSRHMHLFNLEVLRGRNLTEFDGAAIKRVCVIRAGLPAELGVFRDPLGMQLQVGDRYYEVVGVLRDQAFLGYARKALDIDAKTTEIYVPYETMFRRLGTRTVVRRQGSREMTDVQLSQVVVSVNSVDDVLPTARMLKRVLELNHEDQDFEMVVPLEVLEQRRRTQRVFHYFLVAIALISLLVGAIGIANIMLATVTERTREIGVRRALGARRRDIMAQFLTETTVISTLGGLLGVGLSFPAVRGVTWLFGWDAIVTLASILLAVGISVAVGVLSGIFPARRAALLDPIAALRHE